MKKIKFYFWASTILMIITGAFTAVFYFTNAAFIDAFHHLGFPDYFRIELGIAKILGAIVLLTPTSSLKYKDFAYSGFAIVYVLGFIAHSVVDGNITAAAPLIPLVFLIISYLNLHKLNGGIVI